MGRSVGLTQVEVPKENIFLYYSSCWVQPCTESRVEYDRSVIIAHHWRFFLSMYKGSKIPFLSQNKLFDSYGCKMYILDINLRYLLCFAISLH